MQTTESRGVDTRSGRFARGEPAARSTVEGAVKGFAALADLRDGYGAEHTEVLVGWACAIGREMGLPEDDLHDLGVAARLHDIGKVGIPDRILLKPGRLDEAEWSVMRRHAVLGAQVLEHVEGLERVAKTVRHHHERWDGRGYPDGLGGEEIPHHARIVGVCEALGALLTDRPYRPAYDPATAVAVLSAGSGAQFDPQVVEALVAAGITGEDLPSPSPDALAPPPSSQGSPRSRLMQAFERLEGLPAASEARQRLAALLEVDEDAGLPVDDVTAVVESDIALTVAVLRLANLDRTPRNATAQIPEAVQRLGPAGLRDVVERLGSVGVFQRVPGWEMTLEQFRIHAVATQRAADHIARALGRERTDELLVMALLHDIGKLVLANAHAGYPSGVHGAARTPEDRLVAERRELGVDHAVAGGVMARRWRLPESVATAVEHHHDPSAEGDVAIVRLADMLAHHGHGRPVNPRELVAVAGSLGLSAPDVRSLMHDLPQGASRKRSTAPSPLARQETAVLRGLAEGKLYKEIATDLGVSLSTVRSHASSAYAKLGVPDRAQAVLLATANGWI